MLSLLLHITLSIFMIRSLIANFIPVCQPEEELSLFFWSCVGNWKVIKMRLVHMNYANILTEV